MPFLTMQSKDKRAKKTKKKMITEWINSPLVELNSAMRAYYERALGCCKILVQVGNVIFSRKCNCRTCIHCNSIRTASYIAGYGEQVLKFNDPQFVTLTAPTVQCYDSDTLRHYIDAREFVWRLIYKNASKDKKGVIKLVGLKAMEITARPDDYYHIHFHFIVNGLQNAIWLKEQWLKHYKDAEHYLQVIKPITSKEGLLEVFKYGTKFIDKEKKIVNGKVVYGYKAVAPERTDLIMQALLKKRLIGTFGGLRRVKDEDVNEIVKQVVDESLERRNDYWAWVYNTDWYSYATGEKYSNFIPSKEFRKAFSNRNTNK